MHRLQVIVSILFATLFPLIAIAGGGTGSGAVDVEIHGSISTESSYDEDEARNRNQIALEYALENDVFVGLIEDAVIKVTLITGGVPTNATDIGLAIKSQADRIDYADKNGLDLEFWTSSIAEIIEVVLTQTLPLIDAPLTAAKMTLAFATAYTYGYFFSPEARAL